MATPDSGSVRFDLGAGADASTSMGDYEFDWTYKLGEGAYGSVYRGCHTGNGTLVAVKVVSSDRVKEDELESISKAQSSCVVRLLDVLKNESLTYIIMELCDTDLNAFLNTYGKLSEQNLTVLARCLAEGYLVLHRHGIVHRDIKPQNILLKLDSGAGCESCHTPTLALTNGDTPSPRTVDRRPKQPSILVAKFADFGCSRVRRDRNGDDDPANCAGTFFYMAPEVRTFAIILSCPNGRSLLGWCQLSQQPQIRRGRRYVVDRSSPISGEYPLLGTIRVLITHIRPSSSSDRLLSHFQFR